MIFHYGHQRLPQAVTLHGYEAIIQRITSICAASLQLDIHTDHLGSVRMLTIPQKNLHGSKTVQYIEYDSFGNVIACANPGFRFPLGFAGGLNDPFTGFVRFGFRDYDPVVGRFTAKDHPYDLRHLPTVYVHNPNRRVTIFLLHKAFSLA